MFDKIFDLLAKYISGVAAVLAENRQLKANLEACKTEHAECEADKAKGAEVIAQLEKALADLTGFQPSGN